jgi:hypothetical protein
MVQVDLSGFGPINNYTWTTFIYFHGNMRIEPATERLPIPSVGAIDVITEEDSKSCIQ